MLFDLLPYVFEYFGFDGSWSSSSSRQCSQHWNFAYFLYIAFFADYDSIKSNFSSNIFVHHCLNLRFQTQ